MIKTAPLDRSVTRTVITLPPGHELAVEEHPLAFSPDGRLIAYVSQSDETTRLYLRALDQLDAKPIEGAEGAANPFFSPDSQWVGFTRGTEFMKVPISGGAPVKITDVARPVFGFSWGPDGRIVYTSTNTTGLLRVSAEGGEPEVLTVLDRERGEKGHRWAEVLPGGKAVLFTVFPADIFSFDDAPIAVLSLETGEYRVLIEGGTHARYSATGHLIYARAGSLLAVPFDVDALQVKGTPVPVLQGVTTSPLLGNAPFGVSRDGSLLYAPGNPWGADRRVISVDREGRSQPLIETARGFYGLRLSPDGSSLALAIDDANISLWVYDIARSTMTRLASGFDNQWPVWAPDGNRVVFWSNRVTSRGLFLMPADGSGEAEQLTTGRYNPGSWSPDGKSLAVRGSGDIWLLSMEGDRAPQPIVQTNFDEGPPIFSPNGQWLAYASDESGRNEIYIRPFPGPGRRWQVSTDGGTIPRWKADGAELFYRNGDKMMVVTLKTEGELRLGNPKLLFERRSVYGRYDVMPDGQSFVMIDDSEGEPAPTELILVHNWAEELKRLVPTEN